MENNSLTGTNNLKCTDLADVTKLVTDVTTWEHGLNIALWDQNIMKIGYNNYVEEWQLLLKMFDLNPGMNL